ncbi:MAG: hypothetical protein QNL62_00180 [Gammaproteobacteria bacterium]|nr:hypothetical protein [Gammaproteobacteria bacterium]
MILQAQAILDALVLAFFINAPIQIIITIGQWLLMARFIAPQDKTISDALACLALTYISAYLIALLIWLFWPLAPDLIMYNNRISIPAVLGEIIAIPFWLKKFAYLKPKSGRKSIL